MAHTGTSPVHKVSGMLWVSVSCLVLGRGLCSNIIMFRWTYPLHAKRPLNSLPSLPPTYTTHGWKFTPNCRPLLPEAQLTVAVGCVKQRKPNRGLISDGRQLIGIYVPVLVSAILRRSLIHNSDNPRRVLSIWWVMIRRWIHIHSLCISMINETITIISRRSSEFIRQSTSS